MSVEAGGVGRAQKKRSRRSPGGREVTSKSLGGREVTRRSLEGRQVDVRLSGGV